MKRTTKKILLTAAAFSCVLNMNGCAYGPPPEEAMQQEEPAQVVLEVEDDETDTAEN